VVVAAAVDMTAFGGGIGDRNTTDGARRAAVEVLLLGFEWGRQSCRGNGPLGRLRSINELPRPAIE
jgi:hypothetical protein